MKNKKRLATPVPVFKRFTFHIVNEKPFSPIVQKAYSPIFTFHIVNEKLSAEATLTRLLENSHST